MNIFISIPISGLDRETQRQHADIIKASLSRQGHRAFSTFDVNPGYRASYHDRIAANIRALFNCQAIFFCKGWESSLGCRFEHYIVMCSKSFSSSNPNAIDFAVMFEQES